MGFFIVVIVVLQEVFFCFYGCFFLVVYHAFELFVAYVCTTKIGNDKFGIYGNGIRKVVDGTIVVLSEGIVDATPEVEVCVVGVVLYQM